MIRGQRRILIDYFFQLLYYIIGRFSRQEGIEKNVIEKAVAARMRKRLSANIRGQVLFLSLSFGMCAFVLENLFIFLSFGMGWACSRSSD